MYALRKPPCVIGGSVQMCFPKARKHRDIVVMFAVTALCALSF